MGAAAGSLSVIGARVVANSDIPKYGRWKHWPFSARRRNISWNFVGLSSGPALSVSSKLAG
jgi:hypothetical protein